MSRVVASAPGKAILCGEYAVLDGAPAIVTALDCRATVIVEEIPGEETVIDSPGMTDDTARFQRESSGNLRWTAGRFRLVEEVFDEFRDVAMPALSLTLDTRAFRDPDSGKKLGLGSSAALAVALASALNYLFDSRLDVYALASRAHWAYQAGRGSGADIAASFHGGTICFEKRVRPQVRALDWPVDLAYRVLWSGHPASTSRKLVRVHANRQAGKESAGALAELAVQVAKRWREGLAPAILDGLRDYVIGLQHFSNSHRIGIFAAGHQSLLEPAARLGLVYKPCGAGGGDIGIAFGTDEEALTSFCNHARNAGFTPLDIAVGANGIMTKGLSDP
jgi:phosphomevalonate kinase